VRRAFDAVLASRTCPPGAVSRRPAGRDCVRHRNTRDLGELGPDPRKFVTGNIWLVPTKTLERRQVALRARLREQRRGVLLAVVSQDPSDRLRSKSTPRIPQTFDETDHRQVRVLLHQSASKVEDSWHYLPMFSPTSSWKPVRTRTSGQVHSEYVGELCDMNANAGSVAGLEHEVMFQCIGLS